MSNLTETEHDHPLGGKAVYLQSVLKDPKTLLGQVNPEGPVHQDTIQAQLKPPCSQKCPLFPPPATKELLYIHLLKGPLQCSLSTV